MKDELLWCKHSFMSWTKDNKGFFYARYEAPKHGDVSKAGKETDKLTGQRIMYHIVGTDQKDDILIYQDKENPFWLFGAGVTDDGEYLAIQTMKGTEKVNLFSYAKIDGPITKDTKLEVEPLIDEWIGQFDAIHNNGTVFYFQTNFKAPQNKVIMIDIKNPKQTEWADIIPEDKENILQSASVVNNKLIVSHMVAASDTLSIYDLGSITEKKTETNGTELSDKNRKRNTTKLSH